MQVGIQEDASPDSRSGCVGWGVQAEWLQRCGRGGGGGGVAGAVWGLAKFWRLPRSLVPLPPLFLEGDAAKCIHTADLGHGNLC